MNAKTFLVILVLLSTCVVNSMAAVVKNNTVPSPAPPPYLGAVQWSDLVQATVNANNSITKTLTAYGYNSGGVSQNVLTAGTNGYLEFTYSGVVLYDYVVSLAKLNNTVTVSENDFSFFVTGTQLNVFTFNTNRGVFGPLVAGDVLRIERIGAEMRFSRNGTVLVTVPAPATDNLRVDVLLRSGLAICPPITVNFAPLLVVKQSFTAPGLANNNGSIALTTEAAGGPLIYNWLSGETTAVISNKPRGDYSVTVNDAALGQTVNKTYKLGYAIDWINIENVNINANNSITKSNPADGDLSAGAFSSNKLLPAQDGWIEFVANEAASTYTIGLSLMDAGTGYNTIDFAWIIYNNGAVSIIESGLLRGTFESLKEGDVFRIAREGSNIVYYQNNVAVRTVATNASNTFYADLSILNSFGPTPVVTASFDKQLYVKTFVTQPETNNTGGNIALSIAGAYTPLSIVWSSGETSSLIVNKARGNYSVTITDAQGRTFNKTYQLGYPSLWTDLQKTSLSQGYTLTKTVTNGNSLFDASGVSTNILLPGQDGSISFFGVNPLDRHIVGLSRLNAVANINSVEFGFYFASRLVYIYESGANRGIIGNQAADNVYTISRTGSTITYLINNQVVRTVAAPASYQLVADVSLERGVIPQVSCTFTRSPQTFYCIGNGNWNNPAVWSLSAGGPAVTVYPAYNDQVIIRGYALSVLSGNYCGNVSLDVTNDNTQLLMDGVSSLLDVSGSLQIKGENNPGTVKAVTVRNLAKINIRNP